jgi:hypothetical protein
MNSCWNVKACCTIRKQAAPRRAFAGHAIEYVFKSISEFLFFAAQYYVYAAPLCNQIAIPHP